MRSVIALSAYLWLGVACAVSGAVHGCAGSPVDRTQTALDTMALVIDPAYAALVDTCLAQQDVIVSRAEALNLARDQTKDLVERVRSRCHPAKDGFEYVRSLHAEAVRALEDGDTKGAENLLRELTKAWQALKSEAP